MGAVGESSICMNKGGASEFQIMDKPITFETLPEAMSYLIGRVEKLESVISSHLQKSSAQAEDRWMNTKELREYLPDHPAECTVYSWVAARAIPCHKTGKKLQFLKSEIDAWIMSSKRKTEDEMEEDAVNYVNERRLRR